MRRTVICIGVLLALAVAGEAGFKDSDSGSKFGSGSGKLGGSSGMLGSGGSGSRLQSGANAPSKPAVKTEDPRKVYESRVRYRYALHGTNVVRASCLAGKVIEVINPKKIKLGMTKPRPGFPRQVMAAAPVVLELEEPTKLSYGADVVFGPAVEVGTYSKVIVAGREEPVKIYRLVPKNYRITYETYVKLAKKGTKFP